MQAMTARDSFVMTNTLLNGTAAATTSIGFTAQPRQLLFFWTNLTCGKKQRCDLRVNEYTA